MAVQNPLMFVKQTTRSHQIEYELVNLSPSVPSYRRAVVIVINLFTENILACSVSPPLEHFSMAMFQIEKKKDNACAFYINLRFACANTAHPEGLL